MRVPVAGRSHHFVLSDGVTLMGFIGAAGMKSIKREPLTSFSMKTRSGDSKFSDLEPPFASRGWDSWVGGRGQEDDEDGEQYYDSSGSVNTLIPKRVILGPLATSCYNAQNIFRTGVALSDGRTMNGALVTKVAIKCPVGPTAITLTSFAVKLRESYPFTSFTLQCQLYSHNSTSGEPDTALATSATTFSEADVLASYSTDNTNWYTFAFASPVLSANTTYWFVFSFTAYVDPGAEHVSEINFGCYTGTWAQASPFVIRGYGAGAWLAVSEGYYPSLSINGSVETIDGDVVAYERLSTSIYAATEPSSGGADLCRISEDLHTFTIIPPATSGLAAAVTSMCAVNDTILYMAQGSGTNYVIRYNGSAFAADGTNDAALLCLWRNKVWRARGAAGGKTYKISGAPFVAWGANLTFGTELEVGDQSASISAMWVADHMLYMIKEDASLWVLANPDDTMVSQVYAHTSQKETDNGKGAAQWKVFSFIPNLYGLRRYTASSMDEVGPNKGSGMPLGRTGRLRSLVPAVNWMLCALDAGTAGTSCIMAYNELGWHEIARALAAGSRIRALYYAGGAAGHLFYGEGNTIRVVHLPDTTNNPLAYAASNFMDTGHVITSWDDRGVALVPKLYRGVTIHCDLPTGTYLDVYYQLDNAADGGTWVLLGSAAQTGKTELSFATNITGYRIRFKVLLSRAIGYATVTPQLLRLAYEYLERPIPNYVWQVAARLEDYIPLLDSTDGRDEYTAEQVVAQIDSWAGGANSVQLYLPAASQGGPVPAAKTVAVQPAQITWATGDYIQWHRVALFSLIEL